jgi:PAS domain-containing protein
VRLLLSFLGGSMGNVARSWNAAESAAAGAWNEARPDILARLRGRSSGLRDALEPLLATQLRLLGDAREQGLAADDVVPPLLELQTMMIDTLAERYDALDSAVRESELPFAEIDHAGRIAYANDAFAEHVRPPLGRDFASLFGARTRHVADALVSGKNVSLRVDLEIDGLPHRYRAEIGPLRDDRGEWGAYVLLLGLRAEEMRLDAALDGIMRVDLAGQISFANSKALAMLEVPREILLATPIARWLRPRGGRGSIEPRVWAWLLLTEAMEEELELVRPGGSPPLPVRVSVVPYFDGPAGQSGILITLSSLAEEIARQKLRALLSGEADPYAIIRKAVEIVRGLVPCDLAVFGIYTADMKQYRALLLEPVPDWPWGTRWFDVGREAVQWLRGPETWHNEVPAFVAQYAPEQRDDPVVQAVQRDGLSTMIILPVSGPGETFQSGLTLLSKDHRYDAEDLRVLRDLGLEEVFLVAEAAIDRNQADCMRVLKHRLSMAENGRALARTLARGVLACFGWEYAGVFRVDRRTEEFVLFEQHDVTEHQSLGVAANYRQKLKDGMLGHCYRQQSVLVAARVIPRRTGEPAPFDFIQTAKSQRSAMTVPLFLNGRIELVLDLESSQENAFAGPDKQAAEALAADCEQIFAVRWHEAIDHALMDAIEQAAVIVDPAGVIRKLNAAARAIVGHALDVPLCEFAATPQDRDMLQDPRPREPSSVSLRLPGTDVRIPTLASQRSLNDDYEHRMWLFTNLREQRWERDWRYLDQTVSEVARHTRAPLLIADGLLRGAAGLLRKPGFAEKSAELLDRAATQLSKADLTFERLSDSLTVRQDPVEPPSLFDVLELLRQSMGSLPADDADAVELSLPEPMTFVIEGWPDRLGFAFRSLLGYLLLSRGAGRVAATAAFGASGELLMAFTPPRDAEPACLWPDAADPIAEGEERARQMVALSPEAIQHAVEQHHGTFRMPAPDSPDRAFLVSLPPRMSRSIP